MTRSLSRASHLSEAAVTRLLDTIAHEAAEALARGESFTIPGIGVIKAAQRKPRPYNDLNNPGTTLMSQPHTVLKFRPADTLIAHLNTLDPEQRFKRPNKGFSV